MESEIMAGAIRCGMIRSGDELGLEVASRTDRGVHARGNVLALTSGLQGASVLRALNGAAPDLWFDRAAALPPEFQVRHARMRWYRYFEPRVGHLIGRWREGARCLRGEVDVRSFGHQVPTEYPIRRTVERVTVTSAGPWLVIDVRAPAFVWGMVRKIVGALRAFDEGELSKKSLMAAVRGEERLTFALAEPDRLVLWEVDHGIPWTVQAGRGRRRQIAYLDSERTGASVRAAILGSIDPWSPGGPRKAGPTRAD